MQRLACCRSYFRFIVWGFLLSVSLAARSQSTDASQINGTADIPRFIPFSSVLADPAGKPVTTPVNVVFALYSDQQGGAQLWSEIQKIQPDGTGHYSVLLGSTTQAGIPQDIFSTAQARWIGVSVEGEQEMPRVMLLSVPYALKAGDAQTLGGLPPSAFLQAQGVNGTVQVPSSQTSTNSPTVRAADTAPPISGTGSDGYLPVWTGANTLGNSTIYQSGTDIKVGNTVLEGDGISAVNVKAFGAKGDGVTDDTAAIKAAIAAIPPTGGELFFPPGKYMTQGGFTLASPTEVVGVGQAGDGQVNYGSLIVDLSPTSTLFTVTAGVGLFRNLGLANMSPSAPTAGAGIFVNGTAFLERISYDSISVAGFYDDIHVGVGSSWVLRASHIQNPVRYGLYVQNTVVSDDGDWTVTDNYFEGGKWTSPTTSAAIYIESSGGGKISENKVNATYGYGILMNVHGSVQTLINDNDIENVNGPPIDIVQGWPYITIVNNFLNASGTQPCILANGLDGFYIGNNLLETTSSAPVPYAVVVTNSHFGTIGTNTYNHHFTNWNSLSGGNLTDASSPSSSSQATMPQTITGDVGNTLTGLTIQNTSSGVAGAGINLQDVVNGVTYTGSIVSSWWGNGMTFTVPRDLAGKGFYFNSNDGTNRFFIDSATGEVRTGLNILDDGHGNASLGATLSLTNPNTGNVSTTLALNDNGAHTINTGFIQSSWWGNGMTFTAPRDFKGKGFLFNGHNGTNRFFIDSASGKVTTTNNTLDDGSGNINIPAGKTYEVGGNSILPLSAMTGPIGGALLGPGQCAAGSATITGAALGMGVIPTPMSDPGDAFYYKAFVSSPNVVTVKLCSVTGGTPAPTAFNIRVME